MNFVEDKEWKNSLLMVSKVVSLCSGVLDLWGVYRVLEGKKKKNIKEIVNVWLGGVEWESGLTKEK